MNKRSRLLLGVAIILVAMGYLMFVGFTRSATYFLTVSEVLDRSSSVRGKPLKVSGTIVGDSIQWDIKNFSLKFVITDGNRRLAVEHKGVRPDNFEGGKQVILDGSLREDGVFVATQVLVQCPTKYERAEQ